VSDLERRRREFLEKILATNLNSEASNADHNGDGLLSDPIRLRDLFDGLPIPCGGDLVVNPFS